MQSIKRNKWRPICCLPPARVLSPALHASADEVLVLTDHAAYDWDEVGQYARCVVDARNATAGALARQPAAAGKVWLIGGGARLG